MEDMSFLDDMPYQRTFLMGVHVLLQDMSYLINCLNVGCFFLEDMSYWMTFFPLIIHSYICLPFSLCKYPSMHLWKTCLTVGHVSFIY